MIDFTTLLFGNYSTSEVNTRFKWIDGKTIYKKTVSCGALPNNGVTNTTHNITSFSNIISANGFSTNGSTWITLPYASPAASDSIYILIYNNNIQLYALSNKSAFTTSYITLFYTK